MLICLPHPAVDWLGCSVYAGAVSAECYAPSLTLLHAALCPPTCSTAEEMSAGLAQLGYDLEPSEVAILMQQLDIDADGQVYDCHGLPL